MIRHKKGSLVLLGLFLAVILVATTGWDDVRADDVDVYKTTAKNGAMLVIDNSGSMSWPVYDGTFNYANFMKWMIDQGLSTDSENTRSQAWFDVVAATNDTNHDYNRLDPDQIYLVSSYVGHDLITYTDSNGDTKCGEHGYSYSCCQS